MSAKQVHETENTDTLRTVSNFWQRNQKLIISVATAIVILVAGWVLYQEWVVKPKETKAQDAIFKAQQYFAQDSFRLAYEGNTSFKGFKYIANNYSGTKPGNLAEYYAGVCCLHTGDFNNAVKYLKDFSTDADQIQMMAYGALGDAYSELNKKQEAVDAYKKAASAFKQDDFNSSEYLFRAALLNETMGKTNEAVALYKELKENFPKTDKGFQADKYIYRLSIEKNN
ncbi:MAG: hypothetical protein JWN76_2939 [Chitinophagaceae bacterium]|nr:hypothetical protein [Chitinophagaceae bacterium]